MKKLIFLMGIFGMSLLHAQNNIPEAQKGVEYGAGVPENITYNVQSPDQVIKSLKKKNEIDRVTIKGKVTAVCPKKGCWVTLENSQNVEVFVKMKDYAFFLPQNIAGKTILLDAKVTKQETSVKELRHYAEDAGKSKEEIAKITKPKVEIRVLANGIKVID